MTAPEIQLNFGVYLDGQSPQFRIYDDSAASYINYTIPAGTYFYNHSDSTKNIVNIINLLAAGYLVLNRINDRQLLFDFVASADDFYLLSTDSEDSVKLAEMLGLYNSAGDLTHYIQAPMSDGYYSHVTLCSWFANGGLVWQGRTVRGLPSATVQYAAAQSGETAGISTGRRTLTGDLIISTIDADAIRETDETIDQATTATLCPDDTTSFWRAYLPERRTPCFYGEFTQLSGDTITGEWYITEPIGPEQCKQSIANYAGLFDVTIRASYVPVDEQDKFLYFGTGAGAYFQVQSALFNIVGDLTMIIDFNYTGVSASSAYLLSLTYNSNTPVLGALNFSNTAGALRWIQGTSAGYDLLTIATVSVGSHRVIVQRTGQAGVGSLKIYVDGTLYTLSPTKTPVAPASTWLIMMNCSITGFGPPDVYGHVKFASIRNGLLTAAELSNALLGINPAPETMTANYKLNELGGNLHLDTSGNGLSVTSVSTTWQVIP
jgi:hypothetical protein